MAKTSGKCGAFTLVELLVSMAILSLLLVMLLSMTNSTQRIWSSTTSRTEEFRDARAAFETITRRLSQATLNTYWDYEYPGGDTSQPPTRYVRQSELRFISGVAERDLGLQSTVNPTNGIFFQAALGFVSKPETYGNLENLLNTWGYYIEFGSDSAMRPDFITTAVLPARYRFRLMEMMEPSEELCLYQLEANAGGNSKYTTSGANGKNWYLNPLPTHSQVLAENIVALVIIPKLSPKDAAAGNYTDDALAPNYFYDSTVAKTDPNLNTKSQLPPVLQVTMVAVEEGSYGRALGSKTSIPSSELGLAGLFKSVGDTVDVTAPGYARDLKTLTDKLTDLKITYRVFTTTINIKTAKWSRNQTN